MYRGLKGKPGIQQGHTDPSLLCSTAAVAAAGAADGVFSLESERHGFVHVCSCRLITICIRAASCIADLTAHTNAAGIIEVTYI